MLLYPEMFPIKLTMISIVMHHLWLRISGCCSRLISFLCYLLSNLDTDLPDIIKGRVETAHSKIILSDHVSQALSSREEHSIRYVVDTSSYDTKRCSRKYVGIVTLAWFISLKFRRKNKT